MLKLSQLEVGNDGVVESINADQYAGMRLLEMGMTPGCHVKVIGVAPLGDPLEVELRGYRLSLRRTEADLVLLQSPSN